MTGPTARTSESDFQLYKNLETFSRVTNYATLTGRPESAKLQDTDFLPSVRHMVAGTNESIRIANPTDFDAVTALLVASYSSLLAAHYDSNTLSRALPYLTAANPTLLASDTYYVVEGELGRLVGCGGWTAAEPGSGKIIEGEAHIRHLATHPSWVRRGIGAYILVRCISDARSFGIQKLHCISTLNAERFYQAVGFVTIRPIDVPMGASLAFPGILMSREIR